MRFEVDEQIEHLVQYVRRARVGAVDLVDDDDDGEPQLEALPEHEARLGQGPFGRVHEQERAVGHEQRALDLTAEIGVARGIDDVDSSSLSTEHSCSSRGW